MTLIEGHDLLNGNGSFVNFIVLQALSDAQDPVTQGNTLGFLSATNQFRGQFETALKFSERMATLGRKLNVPMLESTGHAYTGLSLMTLGRFTDAETSVAQALRQPDLAASKMMASLTGMEPTTHALVTSCHTRWFLGYPDQALVQAHAVRAHAQAVGVPHNSCIADSVSMVMVRMLRGEPEQLMEASQAAFGLCEKYGHAQGQAYATRAMGVALCMLGQVAEGVAQIRQGIAALQATGSLMHLPETNRFLAEQCLAHGRLSEARVALDDAFHLVEPHNDRWWEAELYRIKGELLLAENAGDTASAEACFRKALEVARAQQAKSLELRAAISLARLLQKQDRSNEAREVLKPVHDWFTEGFDTKDLVDAKALLATLA